VSELVLVLVLALLAALLAGVVLVQTRGADLLAWGVLALSVAFIADRAPGL
jgi:hypothetical protein